MKLLKIFYYTFLFTTFVLTILTFSMFRDLKVGRLHFSGVSGKSNSFEGAYTICKYDDYGPIMATVNYKNGINQVITCPWSDPLLILAYLSLASTLFFIGSLCLNPWFNSKYQQRSDRVVFISGLVATGLLTLTFIYMWQSIPGSVKIEDYENNEVKVTYSKTIYWNYSKLVFLNLILVSILSLSAVKPILRRRTGDSAESLALLKEVEFKDSLSSDVSVNF